METTIVGLYRYYNIVVSIFFSIIPIQPQYIPYYNIVVSIFFSIIKGTLSGDPSVVFLLRDERHKLRQQGLGFRV